jgi:hypothetical protein
MPTSLFKWREPPSFENLRRENHRRKVETDVKYGTPCEATSPLDLYLLRLLQEKNDRLRVQAPNDHLSFESELKSRIESSGVTADYYTTKLIEYALLHTRRCNSWGIFRDYSDNNPHSQRLARFKSTLAMLAEYRMFTTVSGKTVKVTLRGGLRNLFVSSPLFEQEMPISTVAAQETICVRSDVYCGRSRHPQPKNGTPLALESIAKRVELQQRPLGAK